MIFTGQFLLYNYLAILNKKIVSSFGGRVCGVTGGWTGRETEASCKLCINFVN
jgi:hypothetical protein